MADHQPPANPPSAVARLFRGEPTTLGDLLRELAGEQPDPWKELREAAQRERRRDGDELRAFVEQSRLDARSMMQGLQEEARRLLDPRPWGAVLRDLGETLEAELPRLRDRLEAELPRLRDWVVDTGRAFFELVPENWHHLKGTEIELVAEFMHRTGWSLAYTPSPDVIHALLAAETMEARRRILLEAEPEILADLDLLLEGVRHDDIGELRDHAREALRVFRDGNYRSAQAHLAAIITAAAHQRAGAGRIKRAQQKLAVPIEGTGFFQTAVGSVQRAAATALDDYPPFAVPRDFNRHATVHTVSPRQYERANALSALMLAVSFIVSSDGLIEFGGKFRFGVPESPGLLSEKARATGGSE